MNLLIDRLLKHSGFRWDPATFAPMCEFFESQPKADQDAFVAAAKSMPNRQFESTVYWGIVSGHVVKRDQRCGNCAYPRQLVVHHATYSNRGLEHKNLGDLRTLCWPCHAEHHPHLIESRNRDLMKRFPEMSLEEALKFSREGGQFRRQSATDHRKIRSPWE